MINISTHSSVIALLIKNRSIYVESMHYDAINFLSSGLLVSYLSLKEMKKRGGALKFNWLLFYFHRFWRYLKDVLSEKENIEFVS